MCGCSQGRGRDVTWLCAHTGFANVQSTKRVEPGIKQRAIQQRAVVVVPNKVGHLDLPGADGGLVVGLDLDAVLRVPDIQQQDVKVEDGIRRDEVTCTGGITRVITDYVQECGCRTSGLEAAN